jgi:hypothetical protein
MGIDMGFGAISMTGRGEFAQLISRGKRAITIDEAERVLHVPTDVAASARTFRHQWCTM